MANALPEKERALIDAYRRAAHYLSMGRIYLHDDPLRPLDPGRQRMRTDERS
jgi:phosphoketolase